MLPFTTGVPGVSSVELDRNFESENKDYGGFYLFSHHLLSFKIYFHCSDIDLFIDYPSPALGGNVL